MINELSSKDKEYSPCCLAWGWVFPSSLWHNKHNDSVPPAVIPTEKEKVETLEFSAILTAQWKKQDYLHQGYITLTIAMQATLYFHCFKRKKLLSIIIIIIIIITSPYIPSDLKIIVCFRKKAPRLGYVIARAMSWLHRLTSSWEVIKSHLPVTAVINVIFTPFKAKRNQLL